MSMITSYDCRSGELLVNVTDIPALKKLATREMRPAPFTCPFCSSEVLTNSEVHEGDPEWIYDGSSLFCDNCARVGEAVVYDDGDIVPDWLAAPAPMEIMPYLWWDFDQDNSAGFLADLFEHMPKCEILSFLRLAGRTSGDVDTEYLLLCIYPRSKGDDAKKH